MLRILLAALHLIALGLGLGAVVARGTSLRRSLDQASLRWALRNDTLWGIAAVLWISTGLVRYLGSIEKDMSYYNGNHLFLGKMACLVLIILLEVRAAITLTKWRRRLAAGDPAGSVADPSTAAKIATVSHIQAFLVVIMVFLAVGMARGFGGVQ